MCKQWYLKCLNRNCDDFAQLLRLLPCDDKPNCEIEYARIRGRIPSTEIYCPDCRKMTKKQRKSQMSKARYALLMEAAKAQTSKTDSVEDSSHAGVEQQAESSAMGESRGVFSGGSIPVSDEPFPTSGETEESTGAFSGGSRPDSDKPPPTLRNQRRTKLVSGSDELMFDAPANEGDLSINSSPGITHGPQESNLGASNEALRYGNPADTMDRVVATQPNVPSRPQYQQPAPPSPTLSEEIDSLNAVLDVTQTANFPSPPPFSSFSPSLSNPAATDLLPPWTWSLPSPQFPVHPPSLSLLPIDIVLDMESIYENAENPTGSP